MATTKGNNKVYACVLAAGKSLRMKMDVNKVYYELQGIPVLARTLLAFEKSDIVDGIVLVVNQEDIDYCLKEIVTEYNLSKVVKVVAGGKERYESSYYGVINVPLDADIIMIHDGARPFVSEEIIENAALSAIEYGASCVCVPAKDTMKVSSVDGFITETPNRNYLYIAQTPQSFKSDLIKGALDDAIQTNKRLTHNVSDDSQLVEALGYRSKIVMGDYNNIKITTREDLDLAEVIIKRNNL